MIPSRHWSSYPCQCRGFNPDRASDVGCSPVSPRLQGVSGASLWGWRHCRLSKWSSYGKNWTVCMEPEKTRDGQRLLRDPTASENWTSTATETQVVCLQQNSKWKIRVRQRLEAGYFRYEEEGSCSASRLTIVKGSFSSKLKWRNGVCFQATHLGWLTWSHTGAPVWNGRWQQWWLPGVRNRNTHLTPWFVLWRGFLLCRDLDPGFWE